MEPSPALSLSSSYLSASDWSPYDPSSIAFSSENTSSSLEPGPNKLSTRTSVPKGSSPRLLFYCQHLLGIGHLSRSLSLLNEIKKVCDPTFVLGGPPNSKTQDLSGVTCHQLAPLMMDAETSQLFSFEDSRSVDEIWNDRAKSLIQLTQENTFDFVIVELFPFGRKKFKNEILQIIQQVKKKNPKAKVICSLRDILVEKGSTSRREEEMVYLANTYFDWIWVHSDPELVPLEKSFSKTSEINEKIVYTGFVSQESSLVLSKQPVRKNQILISTGGGAVGDELLFAAKEVSEQMPDYKFVITLGPHLSSQAKQKLRALQAKNLKTIDFVKDLEPLMRQSCLSISMGGYNTLMNVLNTQTPSLIYPYLANREQSLRAELLKSSGLIDILRFDDLEAKTLLCKIRDSLLKKREKKNIRLNGASFCRDWLKGQWTDDQSQSKQLK